MLLRIYTLTLVSVVVGWLTDLDPDYPDRLRLHLVLYAFSLIGALYIARVGVARCRRWYGGRPPLWRVGAFVLMLWLSGSAMALVAILITRIEPTALRICWHTVFSAVALSGGWGVSGLWNVLIPSRRRDGGVEVASTGRPRRIEY